jgi:hypothetical protein
VVFLFGSIADGVVPLFAEQFCEQLALVPALVWGFDVAKFVDAINRRRASSALRLPSSQSDLLKAQPCRTKCV